MSTDKIIDRIQKLLALARNAGTEHEAANAALRARELMRQHDLDEASLRVDDASKQAEPIEHGFTLTDTKKRVMWHGQLALGVAALYDCRAWTNGGADSTDRGMRLFGRKSAVSAASYTFHYLVREVEDLCDRLAPNEGKAYRNAFRLGAASRLRDRMQVEIRRRDAKERSATSHTDFDSKNEQALAIVLRDRNDVIAAYEVFSKAQGFVTQRGAHYSSGNGFAAGKAAGDTVQINGGRGLRAPREQLK